MTTDHARKKRARDLAAAEHISYTAALRRLDPTDRPPGTGATARGWRIGYAPFDDGKRLPDMLVSPGGYLIGTESEGEEFSLIGFADPARPYDVITARDRFAADPNVAIGRHPVVASWQGEFFTYDTVVETVAPAALPISRHPVHALWQPHPYDGAPESFRFRVEQWLENLPPHVIEDLAERRWTVERSKYVDLLTFYFWALWSGDPAAAAVQDWVTEFTAVDSTATHDPFTVTIVADEADRWLAAQT